MMICVIAAMQLAAPPGVGVKEIGAHQRRTSIAKMQIIVRRGARYYLNELLWQRRTNLWRRVTNPALAAMRLTSRTAEGSQSNVKTVKGRTKPTPSAVACNPCAADAGGRCGLSQTALGMERKVINGQ